MALPILPIFATVALRRIGVGMIVAALALSAGLIGLVIMSDEEPKDAAPGEKPEPEPR